MSFPRIDTDSDSKRRASCDVCGKMRVLYRANHDAVETYTCAECQGGVVCKACGADQSDCECPT